MDKIHDNPDVTMIDDASDGAITSFRIYINCRKEGTGGLNEVESEEADCLTDRDIDEMIERRRRREIE